MLQPEGNAYKCKTQNYTPRQMSQGNGNAADKPPDNVHQTGQTARRPAAGGYIGAEGPQRHCRQFQGLQAERDAYDCNHKHHTRYDVFDGCHHTAEHQPDYIK